MEYLISQTNDLDHSLKTENKTLLINKPRSSDIPISIGVP